MFGREDGVEYTFIKCRHATNLGTVTGISVVRISNQNGFGVLEKAGLQD